MPEIFGVHVTEQATKVDTPAVSSSGIPFVVGLAPIHAAVKPAKTNTPVLCTSWDDAVEKLGFSDDWNAYTLCEVMYAHFKLYKRQPVIFCNVLNPATMREEMEAKEYTVSDHKITLPFAIMTDGLKISSGETVLVADEDYTMLYAEDGTTCIVELLSSGSAYSATTLNVSGNTIAPEEVSIADIAVGLSSIDTCMSTVRIIPDLICAPGYSHFPAVAAVMATKAAAISGLFRAKALVDVFAGADGVQAYSDLPTWKEGNSMVDENQILCWPMVQKDGRRYHMSTHLAGVIATVDALNNNIPYESPSNKAFQMDGCCLETGAEVNLSLDQVSFLAENGVVTAFNFLDLGWTCKNNYTACRPLNSDIKDYFIPVSRMFDFVANSIIRKFWKELDKPLSRRLCDSVLDSCNIWLNSLVGSNYLLGARVVMLAEENPDSDLMAGIVRFRIYMAAPVPAQTFCFTVECDLNYLIAAMAA